MKKKKIQKKKVGEKNWWWGASLPELPVARWQQFLSFFFSLFYFVILFFFFFDSRGGLCRKGGTARNVSQPRLLWSGHATHPIHSVVWRDQVNVTPERAQVLFQFSLWQSDWRNQRKVWRKNIHKKKCLGSLAACRSWCSFSLIFNQFWFKKRGKNGGVRFQVIRRTKVKKFKKIDGDDFFHIVRWSPSPSTCGEDQLGDNFTKDENNFSKKQKKKRARFKRNKVAPGEDKYDCALIKSVEGSVFSRPREDLTRVRERFAGNLGSSWVASPLQTSRRIAVLKTKMLHCLDLFDCDQAFFFIRGRVILIHALLDYPIPPRKKWRVMLGEILFISPKGWR